MKHSFDLDLYCECTKPNFQQESVDANSTKAWRAKKHAAHAARAKSFSHYKRIFDQNNKKREEDEDSVVILQWWAENPEVHPYMSKSSPTCGGCYFTNDRTLEKTADALLIDNTRFLTHKDGSKAGKFKDFNWYKETLPENFDRPENQYWVFWPREAASKGMIFGAFYLVLADSLVSFV